MARSHLLSVSALAGVLDQSRAMLANVARMATAELRRRRAAAALEELSPRQLRDLGLPPPELSAAHRGTVLVDGSTMRRLMSLY